MCSALLHVEEACWLPMQAPCCIGAAFHAACSLQSLSSLLKGFCHLRVLPAAHVATLLGLVAGTVRAFFKGNGTNVVKIAPETAIKLTLNDALKRVRVVLAAAAWGS